MPISDTVERFGQGPPKEVLDAVTLKTPKLIGLNYPIETNPTNGYFSKNTNLALIKSNLSSLVRTERGERFMRPDYGCNLRRFLMEPMDSTLFSLIREEIIVAIRKYLSTVSITKLQVFETTTNQLKVNLFCAVKDTVATAFSIGVKV